MWVKSAGAAPLPAFILSGPPDFKIPFWPVVSSQATSGSGCQFKVVVAGSATWTKTPEQMAG
jgi:hypothetical protein